MGGISSEREISLKTGVCVTEALKRLKYDVKKIDMTSDIGACIQKLKEYHPDIVFNALHGKFGEDGCIQGLLNMLKIPYTHSGVLASSIGMDKNTTRNIAKSLGIPVADGGLKTLEDMKKMQFTYPYVAKPNAEGSSIGVIIVRDEKDQKKLFESWPKNQSLLIEEYIEGRELSAAVLGNVFLGDVELIPLDGFYDYTNKYTTGKTRHITPAKLTDAIRKQEKEYTLTLHTALGCRGVTRCDFRLDDRDPHQPRLVFLEINTNPGMTNLSLVPDIALAQQISYDAIIEQLVSDAQYD